MRLEFSQEKLSIVVNIEQNNYFCSGNLEVDVGVSLDECKYTEAKH
jgi:hypothetical protein